MIHSNTVLPIPPSVLIFMVLGLILPITLNHEHVPSAPYCAGCTHCLRSFPEFSLAGSKCKCTPYWNYEHSFIEMNTLPQSQLADCTLMLICFQYIVLEASVDAIYYALSLLHLLLHAKMCDAMNSSMNASMQLMKCSN